jgi:hypothetical protein
MDDRGPGLPLEAKTGTVCREGFGRTDRRQMCPPRPSIQTCKTFPPTWMATEPSTTIAVQLTLRVVCGALRRRGVVPLDTFGALPRTGTFPLWETAGARSVASRSLPNRAIRGTNRARVTS